ncbi:MAG: redoxin domain-containing protein [Gemmatimonadaceae bacterium]
MFSAPPRRPPAEGEVVRDVTVANSNGIPRALSELAVDGLLLVIVYRGNWCAFCLRQLAEYRHLSGEFTKLGIRIVALSVDESATSARLRKTGNLPFELLCDTDRSVITEWDLVNVRDNRSAFPVTYLLDANLRIRFASVDDGYSAARAADVLPYCVNVVKGLKAAQPKQRLRIPGPMWWVRGAMNQLGPK